MWGKEPFDLRLTVLRMIRKLHIIIGLTVLGTLLFGGGYYVKNVLLNRNVEYAVTSTYKVNYVDEPSKSGDYYINEMTWNTYIQSEDFLNDVWAHLQQDDPLGLYTGVAASAKDLGGLLEAKLASDIHVPSTIVTTANKSCTELIADAVEKTMTGEFAERNEQVSAIEVIDPAVVATEVEPDVRPVRAFALSAILTLFFVVVFFLLKELGDDAIWLPATLHRRYGLATVGTVNSPEMQANLEYLFAGKEKIAVCAVEEDVNPMEVIELLQAKVAVENDANMRQCPDNMKEWIAIPAPMLCPEASDTMRDAEGVLLIVKAGSKAGKPLEYVLEYLQTQGIQVTAALLWNADEWLLKTYYRLPVTAMDMNGAEE